MNFGLVHRTAHSFGVGIEHHGCSQVKKQWDKWIEIEVECLVRQLGWRERQSRPLYSFHGRYSDAPLAITYMRFVTKILKQPSAFVNSVFTKV